MQLELQGDGEKICKQIISFSLPLLFSRLVSLSLSLKYTHSDAHISVILIAGQSSQGRMKRHKEYLYRQ